MLFTVTLLCKHRNLLARCVSLHLLRNNATDRELCAVGKTDCLLSVAVLAPSFWTLPCVQFCDLFSFYCTARMVYASAINSLFMKEGTRWELSVISSAYQCMIMSVCHSVELLRSAKETAL